MNLITKALGIAAVSVMLGNNAQAQDVQGFVHAQSDASGYMAPTDKAVAEKLDQWRDLKFGVLFHWGLYAVPGIVESWSICSEDEDWINRKGIYDYNEYKKWYFGLKDQLNPVNFNPEQWADVMQKTGMKYMIFTTKHHDGFCMYDSKYTDFSIAKGPFKNNARRDVLRYVLDAFRNKNFMVGEYFSKPDWHCEWFWNPHFATGDRHINYKKERHPEWWKKYQDFTANQMTELTSNYGKIDILWLDGGWIAGDDVKLDSVLVGARQKNPGLICVDRTIKGKNENYQTPERSIPDKQLSYPWESCITLSNDWGWVPNAPYKTPTKVVDMLIEIVAKGGNLLLGVGPTADGIIEQPAVERLEKIGKWLTVNGEAIYNTRNTATYHDGDMWFTANKDGKTLYALYALPDGQKLPKTIQWHGNLPKGKLTLLQNGKSVKYKTEGDVVTVTLPNNLRTEPLAFRFIKK